MSPDLSGEITAIAVLALLAVVTATAMVMMMMSTVIWVPPW
jgi:hypothetical protein